MDLRPAGRNGGLPRSRAITGQLRVGRHGVGDGGRGIAERDAGAGEERGFPSLIRPAGTFSPPRGEKDWRDASARPVGRCLADGDAAGLGRSIDRPLRMRGVVLERDGELGWGAGCPPHPPCGHLLPPRGEKDLMDASARPVGR